MDWIESQADRIRAGQGHLLRRGQDLEKQLAGTVSASCQREQEVQAIASAMPAMEAAVQGQRREVEALAKLLHEISALAHSLDDAMRRHAHQQAERAAGEAQAKRASELHQAEVQAAQRLSQLRGSLRAAREAERAAQEQAMMSALDQSIRLGLDDYREHKQGPLRNGSPALQSQTTLSSISFSEPVTDELEAFLNESSPTAEKGTQEDDKVDDDADDDSIWK